MKVRVVIYSKPGCHLCEEAKAAMSAANCAGEFTLNEINIETDPELMRKYKNDIPVITIDGIEAFRYRLTSEAFRQRVLKRD